MSTKPNKSRKTGSKKKLTKRATSNAQRKKKAAVRPEPSPELQELLDRIGRNARRIREKNGWTQAKGDFFGQGSRVNLWKIEAGKRNLTLRVLLRLANALGADISDLTKPVNHLDEGSAETAANAIAQPSLRQQELLKRIGRNVQRIRMARGWSQESLEDHGSEELRNFQKIEAGQRNLTLRVLLRLSSALGVDISELTAL